MIEKIKSMFDTKSNEVSYSIHEFLSDYFWNISGALMIFLFGSLITYLTYKFVIYIFNKFAIIEFVNKLEDRFDVEVDENDEENVCKKDKNKNKDNKKEKKKRLTDKIDLEGIVAKAIATYVFLLFFRWGIGELGITEIETFLSSVIDYLPNLFIALLILFFGIRFSNTIYNIIFYTFKLTRAKTGTSIAIIARVLILFFTVMIALKSAKIDGLDNFYVRTFYIGLVASMTISLGIAFGVGGIDTAKAFLESLKKKK